MKAPLRARCLAWAWLATACAEPVVAGGDLAAEASDTTAETAPTDTAAEDSVAEVAAPESAGGWTPMASSELHGLWLSDDGETVRALQFAQLDNGWPELFNLTPVYRLYRYPSGNSPAMIQRGEYAILAGPTLATTPRWAEDPSVVGKTVTTALVPAAQGEIALKAGAGAKTYVKQPSPFP